MSDQLADALLKSLQANFTQLLQTPDLLKHLGISDEVRVSQQLHDQIKEGTSTPLPLNINVTIDPDLTGDQWELGPKPSREAQPNADEVVAPATAGATPPGVIPMGYRDPTKGHINDPI